MRWRRPEVRALSGAAIDVFPDEPQANNDKFVSPLLGMDNVISRRTSAAARSKHKRTSAARSRPSCCATATTAARCRRSTSPSLSAGARQATVLHIHKNVPGILSRINEIFAREHQHRRAVPADRLKGRLRRHRRRSGAQPGCAREIARGGRDHQNAGALFNLACLASIVPTFY